MHSHLALFLNLYIPPGLFQNISKTRSLVPLLLGIYSFITNRPRQPRRGARPKGGSTIRVRTECGTFDGCRGGSE